jgi:hypothetical protein
MAQGNVDGVIRPSSSVRTAAIPAARRLPRGVRALSAYLVSKLSGRPANGLGTGGGAGGAAEYLPGWSATDPAGGASLWVRLPGPYATELARMAPAAGVRIVPGPRFGPDGTMESFLRLPFTAPPGDLVLAVKRLAGIDARAADGAATSLPGWLA